MKQLTKIRPRNKKKCPPAQLHMEKWKHTSTVWLSYLSKRLVARKRHFSSFCFGTNGLCNYHMELAPWIPPGLLPSSEFHSHACHGSFGQHSESPLWVCFQRPQSLRQNEIRRCLSWGRMELRAKATGAPYHEQTGNRKVFFFTVYWKNKPFHKTHRVWVKVKILKQNQLPTSQKLKRTKQHFRNRDEEGLAHLSSLPLAAFPHKILV